MTDYVPLLFFGSFFVLMMAGYPVAFTIGGLSLVFGALTVGPGFFELLPMRIWGIMTNYVLISVPLFVFMGVMLEKSGIAEELLETMALLFRRVRGGLAISVVLVGALLAAATGIVGATVVTMGLLSLPTMLKRKYKTELATGTIAAAGTLGQIIPPSIVLILLGSVLNISIGDLFMGAVIPGLILVVLYILWIISVSLMRPASAPAVPDTELERYKGTVLVQRVISALLPPLLLILAVLGSIFVGIASPTEAAAVGALGASVLTVAHRRFNYKILSGVMRETMYLTSMVFIILVGATSFALVFRGMGGDMYLTGLITDAQLGPNAFLALVMIILFVAGFFMDFIEITFIIVPIVAQIFERMGVDLLWIGILIAMNLQTSFLTPPFGFSLFYLKGVSPKEVTTGHIYRGIIPFVIIQIAALMIVLFFPETATWLPRAVGR
ncbi:MAG: TRAP transporter large permease subunit [Nitrospirota bacterium]